MLLSGSQLINTPVMGLQTGTKLAVTSQPVIDPTNLRILAYELEGPMLTQMPSFLLTRDIREFGPLGMIVDSSDEFVGPDDIIAIKKILDLNFEIHGLRVIDQSNKKLGKVQDYTVDIGSFVIQQISVKRGILQSLGDTELLIHRNQIIEINHQSIIVRSGSQKISSMEKQLEERPNFVNPFRKTVNTIDNK